MSAVTYYHDGGGWVDISGRVALEGWELREESEEGEAGTSTIAVADQALDFAPHGHRPFRVLEPDSEADDDVVFEGFTWDDESSRGQSGGQEFELYARSIAQQVNDANAVWQRPVMRGSDCNRPDETDVERVQWVLSTNEYAIFDDVTTYVHTGGTHNMDANDYRGQSGDQVMRDCAEQSGKNWWAKYINNGATRDLVAWYGRDSHSTYDSTLFLSNDPVDLIDAELLDGTALTWPMQEIKVARDYSRIYCGVYAQYDGGATYRHNSTTHSTYFGDPGPDSHRIMVVPMPNVHRKATAQRRGDRILADIGDPDIHVACTVRITAGKATMIRAGMRIPLRLTHEPEFPEWTWMRIVNCTPSPVAAGSLYDLALEMTPTGDVGDAEPGPYAPGDFTGTVFAGLQDSKGNALDSRGPLYFGNTYPLGGGGWLTRAISGPLSIDAPTTSVAGNDMYNSITVSSGMTVRIHAVAFITGFYSPAATGTLNVRVNGSVVGTMTQSLLGSVGPTMEVDLHDYHLDAGDVVSVDSSGSGDPSHVGSDDVLWNNSGVNNTFLHIARGTIYDDSLSQLITVGP